MGSSLKEIHTTALGTDARSMVLQPAEGSYLLPLCSAYIFVDKANLIKVLLSLQCSLIERKLSSVGLPPYFSFLGKVGVCFMNSNLFFP